MSRPMFPDEAKDYLNKAGDLGIAHHERHALETVAGLGTEEYPYLVNTDTNGGLYEPAMRVRLVGRWIDVPKKPKEKP